MPTSSEPVSIRFEDVSKHYRLRAGQAGLRDWLGRLGSRIRQNNHAQSSSDLFWALRGVSFDVPRGQTLGIIGSNGAGKSTILKLISGITEPSSGAVTVNGRLSSLIELGAGFHPDLTGRENVFLNGVVLGLSRQQVRQRFDEIVDFSGIEDFIDVPVKRYSSGMHARLGFAVAAHVQPEVLLVDEVLAVGDTAFQFKCLSKIRDMVDQSGCAVVFISHNMDTVQGLCKRVIWLDHGVIQRDGVPEDVIEAYLNQQEQLQVQGTPQLASADDSLRIIEATLRDAGGARSNEFASGEQIIVDLHYQTVRPVNRPIFSVGVRDAGAKLIFLATMLLDGAAPEVLSGSGVVRCRFAGITLMPKVYQVWGSVRDDRGFRDIVPWQHLSTFRITTPPKELSRRDNSLSIAHLKNDAAVYVPYKWEIL